jgi:hypothetical protein
MESAALTATRFPPIAATEALQLCRLKVADRLGELLRESLSRLKNSSGERSALG